ncbi:hypothetical protein ACVINI_006556 [Rhizobium beringeri]
MYDDRIGTSLRALGPQERLMYYYSMRHPRHFCMIGRIAASRMAGDYRRAISAVQARHPLLRVAIKSDADGQPCFYLTRPSETELVQRNTISHWSGIVQAQLERNFDDDAALFRATVVFDEAGAELILTFHHAIADGMAAIIVLEDIVMALAGGVLRSGAVPPPIGIAEGKRMARTEPSLRYNPDFDTRKLLSIAGMPLWRDFQGDKVAVKTSALNRSVVAALRNVARKNRTTVNSAVCVAAAFSTAGVEQRGEVRVLSAIDLRPLLGLERTACAMGAIAGTIGIAPDSRIGFWEHASLHAEKLKHLRNPENSLQLSAALDETLAPGCDPELASGLLGGLNYDLVVSNLGDLGEVQQIGDVRLEAIWGPAGQGRLLDERFVGVVTFGSEMRLIEARPVHRLSILDDVVRMLTDACVL